MSGSAFFRRAFLASAAGALSACNPPTTRATATLAPDSMAIRRDVGYLASDALAGRLTGTPGNDSAAAFLARRYATLGLQAMSPAYLPRFVARPPAHEGVSRSGFTRQRRYQK